MNRIFKLIWNPQRGALVVASELASGHGVGRTTASGHQPRMAILAAACGLALAAHAPLAMAQQAELDDIQQLVERYSQPVEDISALVARASGMPVVPARATAALAAHAAATAAVAVPLPARQAPATAVIRQVRHAGLSVTPAEQIRTVSSALANARSVVVSGQAETSLDAVNESLAAHHGSGMSARGSELMAMRRPRDPALGNRENPVRQHTVSALGAVETGVQKLLHKTHAGKLVAVALDGVGELVDGTGSLLGNVVAGLTGSEALAGTVTGVTAAIAEGLPAIGDNLEQTHLAGVVSAVGGAVHESGTAAVGGLSTTLGGIVGASHSTTGGLTGMLGGVTAGVGNGLTHTVGQLTGNPAPSPIIAHPAALPPGDPRLVPGGSRTSGLVVGSGGLVGTVGTLLGPTLQDLLGGSGYVRNGDTAINSANIVQAYSVTQVLGIPLVNLSPVGTLLDGLGGVTTGSNSHLTVLGGATSDSYIYNINNGDPNGLLGLVLPNRAPAWAQKCLNVLGLVEIDCWAVNAAQDYQVLVGDGAYANGSKEVVIGTNARHELPRQDANDAFAGNGTNDPTNPTGVPTADYDARLGHSVVVGDSALGTANAQTLIGAGATSDKANSVALGYKSNADRGGLVGYTAFGMTAVQNSIGEVAVGSTGRERQITHVAAGSSDHDAVNVAQLRSAIDTVGSTANPFAVLYADDGNGSPDYARVILGNGGSATTVSNLAAGEVSAASDEAINGAQLHGVADSVATHLGAGASVGTDGRLAAPNYRISSVDAAGTVTVGDYNNVGSAFEAVDQSLVNINQHIEMVQGQAVKYDLDAAGDVDYTRVSLGEGNGPTTLTNVAAGSIAAGSSDAITGGQVFGNAQSIATHLGGGALVNADGTLAAPTYTLSSISVDGTRTTGDYADVGSAFAAVDSSINNLNSYVEVALGGVVRYDLDAAGAPDYSRITLGNGAGPTTLANVAVGLVSATSDQAITGAQLHGASTSIATHLGGDSTINVDGSISAPTYAFSTIDNSGNLTSNTYHDVGSALDAVGQSLTNIFNNGVTDGLSVHYDVDAAGARLDSVTLLGSQPGRAVTVGNVAAGTIQPGSLQAVNGGQLAASNAALAAYMGGTTAFDPATGMWTGPNFTLSMIGADGQLSTGSFTDVTTAFDSVSQSLRNIVTPPPATPVTGISPYFDVNSSKPGAQALGTDSLAAGPGAEASGNQAVAIGDGATASAAGSVALGGGSVADRANTVSVGAQGAERQLTNVADGTAQTDAVNVRQLQQSRDGLLQYDRNADGSVNYASATLGRETGVLANGSVAAVTEPTRLRNVAAGVEAGDAVNYGQLQSSLNQATDWSRTYTDERFSEVDRNMRDLGNRASAGIASAMAMAGLPQPYEAGRNMASFAASSYQGEGSIAVGISGVTEGGRWIYKFSGSANTRGDGGVTVGAGIQW
jgi:autotransporter adhesin